EAMRKFDNNCQPSEKRLLSSNSNALYFRTGFWKPSGTPSGTLIEAPVSGLIPCCPKQTFDIGAPVTGSSTSVSNPEVQPAGAVPPIGNAKGTRFVAASSCVLGLPMKYVCDTPAFAASGERTAMSSMIRFKLRYW